MAIVIWTRAATRRGSKTGVVVQQELLNVEFILVSPK